MLYFYCVIRNKKQNRLSIFIKVLNTNLKISEITNKKNKKHEEISTMIYLKTT